MLTEACTSAERLPTFAVPGTTSMVALCSPLIVVTLDGPLTVFTVARSESGTVVPVARGDREVLQRGSMVVGALALSM